MSEGSPILPIGCVFADSRNPTSTSSPVPSNAFHTIGVLMVPGLMESTRMLSLAKSIDIWRVNDRSPPLLAAYADTNGMEASPCTLATLMITPPPAFRMCGTEYFAIKNRLLRLTLMILSHASSGRSTAST